MKILGKEDYVLEYLTSPEVDQYEDDLYRAHYELVELSEIEKEGING